MSEFWLCRTADPMRRDMLRALRSIEPFAVISFVDDASALRQRLATEDAGTFSVIVGMSDVGVSDENLAAAVVRDGNADKVVLVADGVSGSLRSRAARAGIDLVLDMASVRPPADAGASQSQGAKGPQAAAPAAPEGGEGSPEPTVAESHPAPVAQGPAPVASRPAPAAPNAEGAGPILTFASGRGGVGKTTLAATTAALCARWGMRVAVADLDLSCGNLFAAFGVGRPVDLARIMTAEGPTAESMGRSCARCGEGIYLWGPCERPELAEEVMPAVGDLLAFLSQRFDVVIVDTSTTFTDAVAEAAQRSSRLMLVHDEMRGAMAPLVRTSALAVRLGVARTKIVRVQNLAQPRGRFDLMDARGEVGLEGARAYRVRDGGEDVRELVSAGNVMDLVGSGDEYVAHVADLLAQTLLELGVLPDNEEARRHSVAGKRRGRLGLFGRKREAV